jgi:restriction system protein
MSVKPSHRSDPTLRERAAAVPWWAWVGAAAVSHGVFRVAAGSEATAALQYLVPALFIVAAVLGLRLRHADGAAQGSASAAIDVGSMRWREFEDLIGRAFEQQGFHMNEPGAAGSDPSIDLLMRKERQTYLVHCKAWRSAKAGIETVEAARAAMRVRGAVGGFVLSSGRFSREAATAASGYSIRLVDGPALQALLLQGRVQAARAERAQAGGPETVPAPLDLPVPVSVPASAAAPLKAGGSGELALPCPLCGAGMKKRMAKRGVNAGQYFWGCVQHPECRGTRRVRPG